MAKLEFTPLFDWNNFNFLGKRLFDFINLKLNARTGKYVGNGIERIIFIDIIPSLILLIPHADFSDIILWIDTFPPNFSKMLDGTNSDAIKGLTPKKDGFIISDSADGNNMGSDYSYLVLGN